MVNPTHSVPGPGNSRSRSTATRRPTMFQSTMVMPMLDPNYPPYYLPGTGPGESSELWRIQATTPLGEWPRLPPPPSNTRYYVNDERTGRRQEVLPPISSLLGPAISPVDWSPAPGTASMCPPPPPPPGLVHPMHPLPPPPPGLVHPTQTPPATQQPHPSAEGGRVFHLTVIVEKEKNEGTKVKPKVVRKKEQCGCPGTFDLLASSFSLDDLFCQVFLAVGLKNRYTPRSGPAPPATAFWTGQGGCTNTPFKVTTDSQWEAFKAILATTSKSVSDVKVNVNWKELKKWKPLDDSDDELDEGTEVPNVGRFSVDDRVTGDIVAKLIGKWHCEQKRGHATCVDVRNSHVPIHRVRMTQWADRIKASGGALTFEDLPPDDLLDLWGIREGPVPRGRTGPHPPLPLPLPPPPPPLPPTTSTQDQTALLTTAILASVTDSLVRRRSPSPRSPLKRRRETPSPPPLPIGEELKAFIDYCFTQVRAPEDITPADVFNILDKEGYTVKALGHQTLEKGVVSRLTGLPMGAVMSIHVLAEERCDDHRSKKHSTSRY